MTDNKLTDNEIIKALEECLAINKNHFFFISNENKIQGLSIADILDLINRQKVKLIKEQNKNSKLRNEINRLQTEIEHIDNESSALLADIDFRENEINRLQAENERLEKNIETETNHITRLENQIERLLQRIKTIKAEAYQEFANEIFELFPADKPNTVISRVTVKHILKELVGEDK